MWRSDEYYLERTIELSRQCKEKGKTPFASILVDGDGNIIMEQENAQNSFDIPCTAHAEAELMRRASEEYDRDFLWKCTMYTSCEPCPMCTGAVFWANVGRIVYAMQESDLLNEGDEEPMFTITCHEILAKSCKRIQVKGPHETLRRKAMQVHEGVYYR